MSHVTCHMSVSQQPQPQTLPLLTLPLRTVGWNKTKIGEKQQTDIATTRPNRPKWADSVIKETESTKWWTQLVEALLSTRPTPSSL